LSPLISLCLFSSYLDSVREAAAMGVSTGVGVCHLGFHLPQVLRRRRADAFDVLLEVFEGDAEVVAVRVLERDHAEGGLLSEAPKVVRLHVLRVGVHGVHLVR
jgi:hypothetical protein